MPLQPAGVLSPRLAALLLPLGSLVLTQRSYPQQDSTWRDHDRAAWAAYEARDYGRAREQLLRLYDILSGHPRVIYRLAGVEARLGHRQAALQRLTTYAEMGLTHQLATDSDFASLRGDSSFESLVRHLAANGKPVSRSAAMTSLPPLGLVPEDITFDPIQRVFYISSVRARKILTVDWQGGIKDFVASGQDGLWSVLAVRVDPERRLLWATTAAMAEGGFEHADSGRCAVVQYDLESRRVLKRIELPMRGGRRVLGDMTLDPAGDAFLSDGIGGMVYVIRSGGDSIEPMSEAGMYVSPQTPALDSDGRHLFVPDYLRGIGLLDLETRRTVWLPHPENVAVNGIDGLYLVDRNLIAVQNGTVPERVVRLRLDPTRRRIIGWEVLEAATSTLGEPTHGVMIGDDFFYIANSGWDRLADDGSVRQDAAPDRPAIMRMPLGTGAAAGDRP